MDARDDYRFPVSGWTYETMCDEVDALRTKVAKLEAADAALYAAYRPADAEPRAVRVPVGEPRVQRQSDAPGGAPLRLRRRLGRLNVRWWQRR